MMYLIGKIVLFLVAAFVLGFVIAWLAWRAASARRERDITARWERKLGDLQRERDTSMAKLRREVEDCRQQIPTLEASLGDRSDLIARLENNLVEWRAKLPDLEERVRERDAKIGELEAALEDKDQELESLSGELATAGERQSRERDADAGRVQAARKEADELRAHAEAAREEAGEMRRGAEAARTRVQELEVEIERLRTVTDRAKGERDEAQRQLRDLRRQLEEQEAARAELAASLETARRGSTGELFETQPPGSMPGGLLREAPVGRTPDDLKQIRGVGPVLERTLNRLGIYFFAQIAGLGESEVEWVAHHLNTFPGRIARDRWVEQAARLDADSRQTD